MKVPLLEYLDKLEATAHAATLAGATWRGQSDQVLSDALPPSRGYDGHLVSESCMPTTIDHIVATQPKATLALIRCLRLAVEIMEQAVPYYLKAMLDGGEMETIVEINDARQIILEMKYPEESEVPE